MYISDKQFTYDGFPSNVFGLRFVWFEVSADTLMASAKVYNYIKNRANNNFNITKSDYDEPLEFDAEIMSDRVLKEHEVREIYRNFFDKNQFKELKIETNNGDNVHLNCIIISPERIEGGLDGEYGVVGFKVKVICDAPWGWTDEITITPDLIYENMDGNSAIKYAKFDIYSYSDSQDYIYPEITFTVLPADSCSAATRLGNSNNCRACNYKEACYSSSDCALKKAMIINYTDSESRGTCIIAGDSNMTVSMNPTTGIIKSGDSNLISNTNKKFFRLLPGRNEVYVENISEIKIKYREARVLV